MHTALWLAQFQSFISLGFMAVFSSLSLGLAWLLVWFRLCALGQSAPLDWLFAYRFWVRIFALSLALAFAAGVAAIIQLPSIWPDLVARISAIASPLLTFALLSVLLVKFCVLRPMLFAEKRGRPVVHTATVIMVALGITAALACLITLIAWLKTPTGAVLQEGRFVVHHWGQVLNNPAMPQTLGLFFAASGFSTSCLVLAVTAWQGGRPAGNAGERLAFRCAQHLTIASLFALAILLLRTESLGLFALGILLYWRVWWHQTPERLRPWARTYLIGMGPAGAVCVLCGAALLTFQTWPMQNMIALETVMTHTTGLERVVILGAYLSVYGLLLIAFLALIRHTARHGVVPITLRPRQAE